MNTTRRLPVIIAVSLFNNPNIWSNEVTNSNRYNMYEFQLKHFSTSSLLPVLIIQYYLTLQRRTIFIDWDFFGIEVMFVCLARAKIKSIVMTGMEPFKSCIDGT